MNTGFKGTRIGINSVTLSGASIAYEITFVDEDGVTHGVMRHSIPVDADPDISAKADAFVTALIQRAAAVHFSTPDRATPSTQGTTYDLATALGASGSEADEPDGTQG